MGGGYLIDAQLMAELPAQQVEHEDILGKDTYACVLNMAIYRLGRAVPGSASRVRIRARPADGRASSTAD